ncbi:ABC transporter permease [Bradyrhizobium sp. NP1]|uniref:ABC transporter permease n=1 Tax=Bradyrhizobium sp. NP1 TaxID=3049772 RepID=UPI0025A5BFBD|nr:ABC transporter permease [Bradyrhizobium sp. NP1]WJR76808.1 ABC transporter permease [Bradyrhizobium sp. NP1]
MTSLRIAASAVGGGKRLIILVALGGLLVLLGIIGPHIYPVDPWAMSGSPFVWPFQDPNCILGTDALGRDVLAGLVHGTRLSLVIGMVAATTALVLGILVGAIAGYYRGIVDDVLMRLTDTLQTTPSFLMMIVLVAVFGSSIPVIITAIAVVSWPPVARLTRAEYLTLREREYVNAARLLKMGDIKIMFGEILPNALPPILVMVSILVANAILSEAALSFLGLGDPNATSLGTMIGTGRESLRSAWF